MSGFAIDYENQIAWELRTAESMERRWRAEAERLRQKLKAIRALQQEEKR